VAYLWYDEAVKLAVLTAGFAALVLYVLSMVCLVILRRRKSGLLSRFQAPLPRLLPAVVVGLSVLGLVVYPRMAREVVPLALGLYALGAVCLLVWPGRWKVDENPVLATCTGEQSRQTGWLDRLAAATLVGTGVALAWAGAADALGMSGQVVPMSLQIGLILGLLSVTIALVSALALRSTCGPVERGRQGDPLRFEAKS
jgi:ABC-type spermidine/putrescine transport system permease subunit II